MRRKAAPARSACAWAAALVLLAGCSTSVPGAAAPTGPSSSPPAVVTAPASPTPSPVPALPPPAVLVAAGDIACPPGDGHTDSDCAQQTTADLGTGLHPTAVLALGDTQYEDGSARQFAAYDASWGRFRDITHPVVGNHEYRTDGASGYFGYFGDRAGKDGEGWYATDVGSWRVIVLNSECDEVGGCGDGSDQGRWLAAELARGTPRCTLAAWHRPRFSSGEEHGDDEQVAPLWAQLQKAGVDVVLNGHDHGYERFAPQSSSGQADRTGPVEFVVGTGGHSLRGFRDPVANSEVRWSDSFGVLAMTLRPDGYDWRFIGPPGTREVDRGTASCR